MATAPLALHSVLDGFTHTWSGEASAWECDELGHLNMRHYIYKVAQARQMLCLMLGLPKAFKSGAQSSVRVKDFHVKYLGEARPGAPLRIESAITDMDDTEASLCHIMTHFDGRPAATVTERISHISLRTFNPFSWPKRVVASAADFTTALPDMAQPRGLSCVEQTHAMTLSQAQTLGMSIIGKGMFKAAEADVFGTIPAQALMGRTTETVAHFPKAWPEMHASFLDPDNVISGVLLEARMIISAYKKPGDGYVFASGVKSVNPNIRTLVHRMFDAASGEQVMAMEAVGSLMDLAKRKHVKTDIGTIEQMQMDVISKLSI